MFVRLALVALALAALYLWWRPPTRSPSWRSKKLPLIGVGLLALAYLISPIDAIPDVTPVGFIDDLIVVVSAALWIRQQWRQRPRVPPRRDSGGERVEREERSWDPYRVLDVPRGASPETIARAYREQMKLYHPDRVSHLGDELRALAHRKALDIQRAYDELGKSA